MAVGVCGERKAGVPEDLGDDLHRDAGGQPQARRTVTKVVQADSPQPSSSGEQLKVARHVLGVQRHPVLAGEDQPLEGDWALALPQHLQRGVPRCSPRLAFGVLHRLVCSQHGDRAGRQFEDAVLT
ncbi:MAG TPA: hypothetical protein VIJ96_16475 [Acidothermaceae bacterium]